MTAEKQSSNKAHPKTSSLHQIRKNARKGRHSSRTELLPVRWPRGSTSFLVAPKPVLTFEAAFGLIATRLRRIGAPDERFEKSVRLIMPTSCRSAARAAFHRATAHQWRERQPGSHPPW
jgi:hypothetical protein